MVHELAVLPRFLIVQQPHRSASPDFTNPAAGMAVQHETRRVKALHGARIAGLRVHAVLAIGRQCRRGGHGESKQSIFAVVDKAVLGPTIAVRIPAAPGVAIEMNERILQRMVRHLGAAFLGQQQKGEHMGAGGVQVAVAIARRHSAPPQPAAQVLRGNGVLYASLNILENFGITRAQITFSQWQAAIADVPRIPMRLHLARPLPGDFKILGFARRK